MHGGVYVETYIIDQDHGKRVRVLYGSTGYEPGLAH